MIKLSALSQEWQDRLIESCMEYIRNEASQSWNNYIVGGDADELSSTLIEEALLKSFNSFKEEEYAPEEIEDKFMFHFKGIVRQIMSNLRKHYYTKKEKNERASVTSLDAGEDQQTSAPSYRTVGDPGALKEFGKSELAKIFDGVDLETTEKFMWLVENYEYRGHSGLMEEFDDRYGQTLKEFIKDLKTRYKRLMRELTPESLHPTKPQKPQK
jgi:hypothetical protein